MFCVLERSSQSTPSSVSVKLTQEYSGIPENRIIGSGTILDTSRVRSRLSECFDIAQGNVHAYVFGEHGDSSVVPWSVANISNIPLEDWQNPEVNPAFTGEKLDYDEIEEYVRKSGGRVIAQKGATFYAVSISVCHICKCILSGLDTTMTVSTMMHGEYGIEDVCLSTLNTVGRGGVTGKVNIPLTDAEQWKLQKSAEQWKLQKSAEALKAVIRELDI